LTTCRDLTTSTLHNEKEESSLGACPISLKFQQKKNKQTQKTSRCWCSETGSGNERFPAMQESAPNVLCKSKVEKTFAKCTGSTAEPEQIK